MKFVLSFAAALSVAAAPAAAGPKVCAECVMSNMQRLAGDELHGRACGTADENAAARFVADQLKAYKVAGGLQDGTYLQPVQFRVPTYASPPVLEIGDMRLTQGHEIVAMDVPESITSTLAVIGPQTAPSTAGGKVALYTPGYDPGAVNALLAAGALGVIVSVPGNIARVWDQLAERPPGRVEVIGAESGPATRGKPRSVIFAKVDVAADLRSLDGQPVRLTAPLGAPALRTTYNVLGVIHGTAPDADRDALLLSAHYDHLGVVGGQTYHGANDDASGTAAVLEFARMLGARKPPKRTIQFAFFGCEEQGGHGAKYFLSHAPSPLEDLAANLEFEMIGYVDPERPGTLMLTGWERSNLGPTLAAHGAAVGPDRFPEENFFQRSDNIQLARRGVVAQTISAWPVPPTYHQPTDDLAHIDLGFMVKVIQSLASPIAWLANNEFRPVWNPGGQP